MKKIAVEDLIQLFGMVGIIGSLILVGLEMRQSQRIAMAGQQMERTALLIQANSTYTEAGLDWHSIAFLDQPKLADTYPGGIGGGHNNYHTVLFTYENDYFQFSQGLMPSEVWEAKKAALSFFYNQCRYREILNIRKAFSPDWLVKVIDSLQDNCVE
tara:strand:+ start:282 stop:752 length:471 start_codon:yes stop_codon:yes gene_type:complete